MRIAFVTADLEPGKDGVGDYTRLLAEECARQTQEVVLVAFNDRYAKPKEASARDEIAELRLAHTVPWDARVHSATAFLQGFRPEWVSLQYVAYAFQNKGLVTSSAERFGPLFEDAHAQIMFHELWIGTHRSAPLKHRLWGKLQRHFYLQLLKSVRPGIIHSSNPVYLELLRARGWPGKLLPMFGAIPCQPDSTRPFFDSLRTHGLDINSALRGNYWILGFFGALHPVWPPEPLFSALASAAERQEKKILILSAGRLGPGESLWAEIQRSYPAFEFCRFGEQSSQWIAGFLDSIDFGIATSPFSLIGKSASTAAMLEHGLPVIVNREDVHFSPEYPIADEEPLLIRLGPDFPARLAAARRRPAKSRLPDVARWFCHDLREAAVPKNLTNRRTPS